MRTGDGDPYGSAMQSEPQNFSGTFPLAGEKIGPAWREVWRAMSEDDWTDGPELSKRVAAKYGLLPKTVTNLLQQARSARILEVREVPVPGRPHMTKGEYRVHLAGRPRWPDEPPVLTGPLRKRRFGEKIAAGPEPELDVDEEYSRQYALRARQGRV